MFTNEHFRQPIYRYIFVIAVIAGTALASFGQSYHRSVKRSLLNDQIPGAHTVGALKNGQVFLLIHSNSIHSDVQLPFPYSAQIRRPAGFLFGVFVFFIFIFYVIDLAA